MLQASLKTIESIVIDFDTECKVEDTECVKHMQLRSLFPADYDEVAVINLKALVDRLASVTDNDRNARKSSNAFRKKLLKYLKIVAKTELASCDNTYIVIYKKEAYDEWARDTVRRLQFWKKRYTDVRYTSMVDELMQVYMGLTYCRDIGGYYAGLVKYDTLKIDKQFEAKYLIPCDKFITSYKLKFWHRNKGIEQLKVKRGKYET